MTEQSRRTFLRGAGVAAATVAAASVVPAVAVAATRAAGDANHIPSEAKTDSLVAYVKDAKSGEISVMSGDREVLVTDRDLAQRLARIAD
jgi:hypothetical protein